MCDIYKSFMSEVVLPFYSLSIKYLLTPSKEDPFKAQKKKTMTYGEIANSHRFLYAYYDLVLPLVHNNRFRNTQFRILFHDCRNIFQRKPMANQRLNLNDPFLN